MNAFYHFFVKELLLIHIQLFELKM